MINSKQKLYDIFTISQQVHSHSHTKVRFTRNNHSGMLKSQTVHLSQREVNG